MEKETKNVDRDITITLKESEVYQLMLSLDARSASAQVKATLTFNQEEAQDMVGLHAYLNNIKKKLGLSLGVKNNDKQ